MVNNQLLVSHLELPGIWIIIKAASQLNAGNEIF